MLKLLVKKLLNSADKKCPEKLEKCKAIYTEEIRHNQKRIAKNDPFLATELDKAIENIEEAKSLYELVVLVSAAKYYTKKQGYEYFEIAKK